jgi:hypothetical protein
LSGAFRQQEEYTVGKYAAEETSTLLFGLSAPIWASFLGNENLSDIIVEVIKTAYQDHDKGTNPTEKSCKEYCEAGRMQLPKRFLFIKLKV